MKHADITGVQSFHQWCFVSATDPALDGTNLVTANKAWLDSVFLRLYIRNAGNTAWVIIGNDI